jgi:hypothetical protein
MHALAWSATENQRGRSRAAIVEAEVYAKFVQWAARNAEVTRIAVDRWARSIGGIVGEKGRMAGVGTEVGLTQSRLCKAVACGIQRQLSGKRAGDVAGPLATRRGGSGRLFRDGNPRGQLPMSGLAPKFHVACIEVFKRR